MILIKTKTNINIYTWKKIKKKVLHVLIQQINILHVRQKRGEQND